MIKPLYTYRNSEGCRFGAVIGICSMFLLASWYLTVHPSMAFWPVTIFCFGLGAAGFVVGGFIGARIDPPKQPEVADDDADSED
jgi:hypothetical protein